MRRRIDHAFAFHRGNVQALFFADARYDLTGDIIERLDEASAAND